MELSLNPLERLTLQGLLMGLKGNLYIYNLIELLMKECSFSQEELDELKIRNRDVKDGGGVEIPSEALQTEKKIELPEVLIQKLKATLLDLNKSERTMSVVAQEVSLAKKIYPELVSDLEKEGTD